MIVDDVDEVRTISSDQLEATPSADPDAVTAIAKIDDRMVILLNLTGLFGLAALEVGPRPPSAIPGSGTQPRA